jgi:hypothetical protein
MRERVPQLVRVKIGQEAARGSSVFDHLIDAARREPALRAEPQPGVGRVR